MTPTQHSHQHGEKPPEQGNMGAEDDFRQGSHVNLFEMTPPANNQDYLVRVASQMPRSISRFLFSSLTKNIRISDKESTIPEQTRVTSITKVDEHVDTEHVVLRFEGPASKGREGRVFKSLQSIPTVRRLTTNFILFEADFDANTEITSVGKIVNHVRRATGYRGERVAHNYREIDVISLDWSKMIAGPIPIGVKGLIIKGQNQVTIQYRPEIVGARDLLSTSFGTPLLLAPSQVLARESDDISKTMYRTILSVILTIPILVLSWGRLPKKQTAYGAASFALATVIQVIVAGPFYPKAFQTVWVQRSIDMGLLVVLSTTAAYLVSVTSFVYQIQGQNHVLGVYFETSSLLVTLIMVGRLISSYASHQASKSALVVSLQSSTALIVTKGSEKEAADIREFEKAEIDIRLLQYSDVFVVEPDSSVVTDGVVVFGTSDVDESMMTGEIDWIGKERGSSVIAGTMNRSNAFLAQLTHLPGANTIDGIAGMVEQVTQTKPAIQEIADRFAKYFIPAIAVIGMATLIIWSFIGYYIRRQSVQAAVITAVTYAIPVIVVSCPCAIGLAVPLVIVIATSIASKRGVIVKSSAAFQAAQQVTHVVFDKTGTLTESNLIVSAAEYILEPPPFTASLILGLTKDSRHPVASAVADHVGAGRIQPAILNQVKNVVGQGIEGRFKGEVIRIGNSRWLGIEKLAPVQFLLSQGLTVSCVTRSGSLIAVFGLATSLREDAKTIVRALQNRGINVSIVSGDDSGSVLHAATALGISPAATRATCTPMGKRDYIRSLMPMDEDGKRITDNIVLFCGDGVNDAGAIAQADVGIYMNSASDDGIAQRAAAVTLMIPSLSGILTLMEISHAAHRRIVFNFAWSAVYNLVAILYASGAFVKKRLPPQYAGLGELASVLPVIVAALSMHCMKPFGFPWSTDVLPLFARGRESRRGPGTTSP